VKKVILSLIIKRNMESVRKKFRQEMQAALAEAYTNPLNNNEITKAYQNRVPRQGETPTPEKAVRYLAGKVEEDRA